MADSKRVKIAMVDCGREAHVAKGVLEFVRDRYDFEITAGKDADYVFHSESGYDVLDCPGVRIFVTGERVSADFNISDYALCFDRLEFGDRSLWLPLIKLYGAFGALSKERRDPEDVLAEKSDFCSYVMSNTKNSAPERTAIVAHLNRYREVHCGGRWNNNVGGPVADKLAFQKSHKFAIAFENYSAPGYLTEKFAEAAEADAIPVYWGDPGVGGIFNPRAFINCHAFDDFDAVVERVKEIDNDEAQYRAMLAEPWFEGGQAPAQLSDERVASFLANIFDQEHAAAYRRNRGRWGKKYEKRLRAMWKRPFSHAVRRIRRGLKER